MKVKLILDFETEKKARAIADDLKHQHRSDRRVKIVYAGKRLEISIHFKETIDEALTYLDSLLATVKLADGE